jgi:hypothetical protein
MGVLAAGGASLLDIEQIVVRGRLTLDILIDVPPGTRSSRTSSSTGGSTISGSISRWWRMPRASTEPVLPSPSSDGRSVRTVRSGGSSDRIRDGNIDRIFRLSRYPVIAYELAITDGDIDQMRSGARRSCRRQSDGHRHSGRGPASPGAAARGARCRLDPHPERDDRSARRGGGRCRRGGGDHEASDVR